MRRQEGKIHNVFIVQEVAARLETLERAGRDLHAVISRPLYKWSTGKRGILEGTWEPQPLTVSYPLRSLLAL